MPDVVVTVPKRLWSAWIAEGQLPGDEPDGYVYHFWLAGGLPRIEVGERVYIVAHGQLRGYAPLVGIERWCRLRPSVACLMRSGGAVAMTIARPMRGFRGYQYRDWTYDEELPFPAWRDP